MAEVFGHRPGPEVGMIAMWDGLLSNIPVGWVLCDGNNGTPDLTGKFVRSVPNGSTDPGSIGGTDSNSLSQSHLPSHNHTGGVNSAGNHSHSFSVDGTNTIDTAGTAVRGVGGADTGLSVSGGNHSHGGSTNSAGSGSSIDNRPPYFEVAYIMKQ